MSTTHVPVTPPSAVPAVVAVAAVVAVLSAVDVLVGAVSDVVGAAVESVTDSTAASRLTGAGESSLKNHHRPTPAAATTTTSAMRAILRGVFMPRTYAAALRAGSELPVRHL